MEYKTIDIRAAATHNLQKKLKEIRDNLNDIRYQIRKKPGLDKEMELIKDLEALKRERAIIQAELNKLNKL